MYSGTNSDIMWLLAYFTGGKKRRRKLDGKMSLGIKKRDCERNKEINEV